MSAATVARRAAAAARHQSRGDAVGRLFAAFDSPADVPADVWDDATRWAMTVGACFADLWSDVCDVAPDWWDADAIADQISAAVDRAEDPTG